MTDNRPKRPSRSGAAPRRGLLMGLDARSAPQVAYVCAAEMHIVLPREPHRGAMTVAMTVAARLPRIAHCVIGDRRGCAENAHSPDTRAA
jgi:hypothetical protein